MNTEIKSCKDCEFFGKSMDGMECKHPYFKDIKDYSNMIISQDNIINHTIPEKCPLKKEKESSINISVSSVYKSGDMSGDKFFKTMSDDSESEISIQEFNELIKQGVEEEKATMYSVYRVESLDKFFIKFEKRPEREITQYEYLNRLMEKERILEAKLKEPVVFEKKNAVEIEDDYTNHSNGHSLKIYPSTEDDLKDFVSGTCYGTLYYTEDCMVVDSFFNKEKHNGDFQKTIESLYTLCSIKELSLTICNVNSKLLSSIRKMFPTKELIQVNKNTVMFKIYKR